MTMLGLNVTRSEDYYQSVSALYSTLLEGRAQLRPKRAEINSRGEVQVLPIDYLCDVELKAKRVLSVKQYALFQFFTLAGEPRLLPLEAQIALGSIWREHELGPEGPYAGLFFKIKNEQMRARDNYDGDPEHYN